MYLSKVHIRNFRNLRDVVAKFSSGLNVVVGENNIGKTNLLTAIRHALGPASSIVAAQPLDKDDRTRLPDGEYLDEPIRIDLFFDGLDEADRAEFLELLDFNAVDPARSTASLYFEWVWDESSKRYSSRRWGGASDRPENRVSEHILQSVSVTSLGALRDARVALAPGRNSRLGRLLKTLATDEQEAAVEQILKVANEALEKEALVADANARIRRVLSGASGPQLSQDAAIRSSEPEFDRIVNSLRLVVRQEVEAAADGNRTEEDDESPQEAVSELRLNGLGFNNLIYIAVVLSELESVNDSTPLLLVEEPEAHLHPQLQTLLMDHLGNAPEVGASAVGGALGSRTVQTIVTTHSPTVAAHVKPTTIHILHRGEQGVPRHICLDACGIDDEEADKLKRMLDVTRASMLFARGIILVEGISEALLLPSLARRVSDGIDLAQAAVSVVPMAGLGFETFAKLFKKDRIQMPVAIVTDGDPAIETGSDGARRPQRTDDHYTPGSRATALNELFRDNSWVRVCAARVTLEYDLAEQSATNALTMYDAWSGCYATSPQLLTKAQLEAAGSDDARAVLVWRALCDSSPLHGKAETAQALAAMLSRTDEQGEWVVPNFVVPEYLRSAVFHVAGGEFG